MILREMAGQSQVKPWCKEKLVAYKIPKFVEFRDVLPKTMVGKVLRRILVEEENAKRKKDGV